MTDLAAVANSKPKEISLSAVVIRCRCGDPSRIHQGKPCPVGIEEDLGAIGYWHRSPFKRFAYWFSKTVLRKKVSK